MTADLGRVNRKGRRRITSRGREDGTGIADVSGYGQVKATE